MITETVSLKPLRRNNQHIRSLKGKQIRAFPHVSKIVQPVEARAGYRAKKSPLCQVIRSKQYSLPFQILCLRTNHHIPCAFMLPYLRIAKMRRISFRKAGDDTLFLKGQPVVRNSKALIRFPVSILIPDISCVKQIEPIVFRDSAARVAAVFIKPITRSQRNLFPLPIHNILCRIMPPKFCAVPRLKRLPLKEYMIAALPINQAIRVIQQPNRRHDMKMLAVRIAVSDGLFFLHFFISPATKLLIMCCHFFLSSSSLIFMTNAAMNADTAAIAMPIR